MWYKIILGEAPNEELQEYLTKRNERDLENEMDFSI